MSPPSDPVRDLLLIGGGHAHLGVLRDFARHGPPPATRVTLLSREPEALYSGMLPGLVAGRYARGDITMDLGRLARAAGARFVQAEVTALDTMRRQVACADGRPPMCYDLLSLDIGSAPLLLPGAAEHALTLRPLDRFLDRWEAMRRSAIARAVVVGAGAAGVEIALALRQALGPTAEINLIAREAEPLPGLAPATRRLAARALARAGIPLDAGVAVAHVDRDAVVLTTGRIVPSDLTIWATGAAPVDWPRASGLPLCLDGFLAVDATLRSTGDANVFAAGDCATVLPHPRPRAGVFAVRQGPPLARNLRLVLSGEQPHRFTPQRRWLALLLSSPGTAIAARGRFAAEGRWALVLKDWVDRRWVRAHRDAA